MVRYSIERITPEIFAVVVPDDDERAKLFVRIQEYYENEDPSIRRKNFDVREFLSEYREEHHRTYADDWQGFNVPYKIALEAYKKLPAHLITPYDLTMMEILRSIVTLPAANVNKKTYIIGVDRIGSSLMQHELYHGLYYTSKHYRRMMNHALKSLPQNLYRQLRKNVINMGYRNSDYIVHDELQAYLSGPDWTYPEILRGLSRDDVRTAHEYLSALVSDYVLKYLI